MSIRCPVGEKKKNITPPICICICTCLEHICSIQIILYVHIQFILLHPWHLANQIAMFKIMKENYYSSAAITVWQKLNIDFFFFYSLPLLQLEYLSECCYFYLRAFLTTVSSFVRYWQVDPKMSEKDKIAEEEEGGVGGMLVVLEVKVLC